MDAIKFGMNLRKFRQRADMTQSELARQVGVSENYIGHLEHGRKEPSLKVASIMADVLGTTVNDLLL